MRAKALESATLRWFVVVTEDHAAAAPLQALLREGSQVGFLRHGSFVQAGVDIGGWTHHTVGRAGDSDTSSPRGPGRGVEGGGHGLPHAGTPAGKCVFFSEGEVQVQSSMKK